MCYKISKGNNSSKLIKESIFKRNEQTALLSEDDNHKNELYNNSIINHNNNNMDLKQSKKHNYENNSFKSKKDPDNHAINKSKQTKVEININESQEKSFHNSPQSSKKFKLPNSQAPISILDERRDGNSGENKLANTRTILSEFNKQDIENYLCDTPSEIAVKHF